MEREWFLLPETLGQIGFFLQQDLATERNVLRSCLTFYKATSKALIKQLEFFDPNAKSGKAPWINHTNWLRFLFKLIQSQFIWPKFTFWQTMVSNILQDKVSSDKVLCIPQYRRYGWSTLLTCIIKELLNLPNLVNTDKDSIKVMVPNNRIRTKMQKLLPNVQILIADKVFRQGPGRINLMTSCQIIFCDDIYMLPKLQTFIDSEKPQNHRFNSVLITNCGVQDKYQIDIGPVLTPEYEKEYMEVFNRHNKE